MKPEIKKLWVEALRSGKYKQGRGALRDGDAFCCLGVLCDLHRQQDADNRAWQDCKPPEGYPKFGAIKSYAEECGVLPYEVSLWADFATDSQLPTELGSLTLAELNDSGASFEEVAKLIEEKL